MTTVAIIQARMGSSRLPGKVLMDIAGKPMLQHVIDRARAAVDGHVIVATSTNQKDDAIEDFCHGKVLYSRGEEDDVLSRYVGAAMFNGADKVIRITADCALIDPGIIKTVTEQLTKEYDYCANTLRRTYPRGLDVEAMWIDTLLRLDRLAELPSEREHVTSYLYRHKEMFFCRSVVDSEENADLRWTVDTKEDLEAVRCLYQGPVHDYTALLAYARAHPECRSNYHVEQKTT